MRLWMALLALGPACGFSGGSNSNTDANVGDDAPADSAPRLCFGSFPEICFTTAEAVPTAPAALPVDTTVLLDTGSSSLCNPNIEHPELYCVVAGTSFSLPATQTIRAFGGKPLVLLATKDTFDLAGTVDVSSNHIAAGAQATGAAANPAAQCTGPSDAMGTSGGAGGTFGTKGGNGEQVSTGSGGIAAPVSGTPPTMLRGGCPGGNGAPAGGVGGSGGGAVAVIAIATLQFGGQINASGAGGKTGMLPSVGAGGGGSGGMISLEAANLSGDGKLYANGGGGGAGGPGSANGAESASPTDSASGGKNTPATGGGVGGDGATGVLQGLAGANSQGNGGGGGGGGGVGVIRAHGVTTNISPPSSI